MFYGSMCDGLMFNVAPFGSLYVCHRDGMAFFQQTGGGHVDCLALHRAIFVFVLIGGCVVFCGRNFDPEPP